MRTCNTPNVFRLGRSKRGGDFSVVVLFGVTISKPLLYNTVVVGFIGATMGDEGGVFDIMDVAINR